MPFTPLIHPFTHSSQSTRYAGIADCFSKVLKAEGMAGLYRGIGPTIAAVAPFLAFQQSVYDVLKFTALANDVPAGLPLFLSCGAAAGAAAQSMVYPMDLIRRRMQVRAESTTLIGMGVIQDIK